MVVIQKNESPIHVQITSSKNAAGIISHKQIMWLAPLLIKICLSASNIQVTPFSARIGLKDYRHFIILILYVYNIASEGHNE
jgi:hypothetical protein